MDGQQEDTWAAYGDKRRAREHEIVVLVDTTATFVDVMMAKTSWIQLLSLCAHGDLDLAVPSVVLQETQRHWESQARDQVDGLKKKLSRLSGAISSLDDLGIGLGIAAPELASEPVIDGRRFHDDHVARLRANGAELLPMPAVSLDQLLARDLRGTKPFSASGKGFRDALVWESVKETLAARGSDRTYFFVTANDDDYQAEGRLHADLAQELQDQGSDLILVRDLDELLAQDQLKPLVSALERSDDDLGAFLARNTELALDAETEVDVEPGFVVADVVAAAVAQAIAGMVNEEVETAGVVSSGLDFVGIGIPTEIESPSIDHVDTRSASLDWSTYATYDDTTLLVRAAIDASVELSGFIYKSDLSVVEDTDVQVDDWDWNDHMATVSLTIEARLVFQLRIELGVGLEDVNFETAESL